MHPLRIRPAVEEALRNPKRAISPSLEALYEAQTSSVRLHSMRSWLVIVGAIEALMLWGDLPSGPALFKIGLFVRLGLNLPLAAAVFFALPHLTERGRALAFGFYNVVLITVICIEGHYAQPAFATQYALAPGLLIIGCNVLIPVTMARTIWFTAIATPLYIGLSLAPIGSTPAVVDVIGLLGMIDIASVRARYTLGYAAREAFLLRMQEALNTQDVAFANRILLDLSNTDPLTRVANRRCFDDRLNAWWQQEAREGMPLGLLMIDVDFFKSYNDHYGHPTGDKCLRMVALAMSQELRHDQDTLARYGGEEFAVLLPGFSLAETRQVGERLCRVIEALGLPHDGRTDGTSTVTISVGAVTSAEQGLVPEALLRMADRALYQSKRLGRNRLCAAFGLSEADGYIEGLSRHADGVAALSHSASLADDLRSAMLGDHLHLQYQPIYDCRSGEVAAFEALLRWTHPLRGNIAPDTFIPAAEESGMIVAVGKWVLRKACAEAAAWTAPCTLAVNISPVQFSDPEIVATIAAILTESGLHPSRLLLEITEGLQLVMSNGVGDTLNALRALGIGIALDDFGTGYANLSRLRELPFDVVKIDRSFLEPPAPGMRAVDVLTPLVAFARAYGSRVVMEGVETAEQLAQVKALGCDWVQGFYLSRPLSSEALRPLLRTPHMPLASEVLLAS